MKREDEKIRRWEVRRSERKAVNRKQGAKDKKLGRAEG